MSRWHQPCRFALLFSSLCSFTPMIRWGNAQQASPSTASTAGTKSASPKLPPEAAESAELQNAMDRAGSDRVALVRNLEDFLKKYPDSRQRSQIYRALVEASLQLRDSTRAADYAERIVALAPEDMSITLLAIQLLEREGDESALRRAVNYSSRVLTYVERSAALAKSPKISREDWEAEQKRDKTNILSLRGRLYFKLHDNANAENDFRASMALAPTAEAAEKLGEISELRKDLPSAIQEYAQAFGLADASNGMAARREIRQKLGNVWRLAHGSDEGLGDYLLHSYDAVITAASIAKPKRNDGAKEAYDFILRKAPDGASYSFASHKGKVVVLNFWATWCGPCRALEPRFERVAAEFHANPDIVFLAVDCDEDESPVPAYLQEVRPRIAIVFADGLDRFLGVRAFPTIVVLDRTGKIGYRAEGFDPDEVEKELTDAIRKILASPVENPGGPAQGAKSGL